VVAAFVVTVSSTSLTPNTSSAPTQQCFVVSLATGTKCIGNGLEKEKSSTGNLLHDSHAEVLARRGFIVYILR
jgi:tRNA-specific adenosine deaminase 1